MGIGIVRLFSLVLFFVFFFQLNDCEAQRRRGESSDEVEKQIQIGNTFPLNRFSNFWEFNPDITYRWRKKSRIQSISPDLRISNNTFTRTLTNDLGQSEDVEVSTNRISPRLEYNYGYKIYSYRKFDFNLLATLDFFLDYLSFKTPTNTPQLFSIQSTRAGVILGIRPETIFHINDNFHLSLSLPFSGLYTGFNRQQREDPILDERFRDQFLWDSDFSLFGRGMDIGVLIDL